ncbi:unnamed protein product [Dicrocoelium dendriticum]|nr:unnamed protein product [Dicrocoelium dendriticum]
MLRDYLVRIDHALRKPGLVCDILTSCEERTGIGRTIIATVTASLFLLYLLLGHGTAVLVLLIGFLYPAYQSIKAIESPSKDDDTQWLCYWVVFAFLQMVEACTFSLVYYIPIYTTIKCIFLLHCMAPIPENGSVFVYKHVIRPLFLKHSTTIDTALDSAVTFAESIIEESVWKATKPTPSDQL